MPMRWIAIGGGVFCPVAVCQKPGHIGLFVRGPSSELLYKEWQDTAWSEFLPLGIPVANSNGLLGAVPADWPLAACSADADRIDLFARSPDGELLHMTGTGRQWGTFESLGAPARVTRDIAIPLGLAGPPAACSRGPGRISVFVAGESGELLHTFWNGETWSAFESLGLPTVQVGGAQQPVPLFGPLTACSCANDRIGVFLRGPLGDLVLKWWDGARWSEFASLGWPEEPDEIYPAVSVAVPLTGPPAACSWGARRIDVFARGPSGEMLHKSWDGKDWSRFESLGMPIKVDAEHRPIPFTGAIAACTWGTDRLDVFARALDGNLYHAWWDGSWDHD